ncbi:MAG: large subunit ribosomal protein L25 [Gammaproteobacteria bacterium]|jgi:large subunit ribosomal protein L25
MEQFELNAEPRTLVGKGASRRLRRTGKVPGIVYGTDKEPTSIQLDHDNLMHHLEQEAFYSHILTLKIGKETQEVVLRDLQRHPFKARLMHIDLQRINAAEKITMRVPLHIINEGVCPGVKDEKGIVNSLLTQLEVICLPKNLPEYIEVDIIDMHVGDSIHLHELKLPEGIELEIIISGGDVNQAVVSVQQPQAEQVDEVEVDDVGDAAAAPVADEEKPDSD